MRVPEIYDEFFGEKRENRETGEEIYQELKELENLPPEKKLAFWRKYFSRCIRCSACKQVCPLCYCEECILEKTDPHWVLPLATPEEAFAYHIIRFYHQAGRCTSCGECERVCPVNIPLRLIYEKLAKTIKELYDYTPGIDPEQKPPLLTFKPEDKEMESIL